jgi:hypothetical protein
MRPPYNRSRSQVNDMTPFDVAVLMHEKPPGRDRGRRRFETLEGAMAEMRRRRERRARDPWGVNESRGGA